MESEPKYSIIIPSKSGMPYLKYSVNSVLASQFPDLEVIVSLDDTGDGSSEMLKQISDARLKVIRPASSLSMSQHWDFAQSHAKGEWQIFLGQDDMMMTGFSDKFDNLTDLARESKIGVIVARRAYLCWPPVKDPNLKALQYWRTDEISIKDSASFAAKALLSDISYHSGPQMYTTTLVAKSVVESIRSRNQGRLVLGHPQDAYLAASLLKESPFYLFSGQPFSWVGTSSKSAGLAVAKLAHVGENEIARDYLRSVSAPSGLEYTSRADFRHGVNSRYFFDALQKIWPDLLMTYPLGKEFFRIRVDSQILALAPPELKLDPKSLVTSDQYFFLKRLLARGFVLSHKTRRRILRVISRLLQKLGAKNLEYSSIDQITSADELFDVARGFRS